MAVSKTQNEMRLAPTILVLVDLVALFLSAMETASIDRGGKPRRVTTRPSGALFWTGELPQLEPWQNMENPVATDSNTQSLRWISREYFGVTYRYSSPLSLLTDLQK